MKLRILSLVISVVGIIDTFACISPVYRNQDMQMYRASDYFTYNKTDDEADENISLWRKSFPGDFSYSDIKSVVYILSLDSLRRLSPDDKNPFSKALIASPDRTHYNFLMLAKEVEQLRDELNDPWYYPVYDDPYHVRFGELLAECRAGMDGDLAPRYCVQAMRMYMSMNQYDSIVAFWDKHQDRLPKNVLRRMAADYTAGAYEHLGDYEKARELYKEAQNVIALSLAVDPSEIRWADSYTSKTLGEIERIFKAFPNHHLLRGKVATIISEYEMAIKDFGNVARYEYDEEDVLPVVPFRRGDKVDNINVYRKLRDFALKAASDRRAENPGFWLYTAAYLYYLDGKDDEANRQLSLAESARSTDFDRESIQALRILLDFDLMNISRTKMLKYLQWIEARVIDEAKRGYDYRFSKTWNYDIIDGYSISYWYDVLRKVCERGADRLQRKGDYILALQLSNYANYRLFPLVDTEAFVDINGQCGYADINYKELRELWKINNEFDYCNPFFNRMDSLPADKAASFAMRVAAPKDNLDRFLLKGGYFDSDYINEHVGTMYLREMKYDKAVSWLERVSYDYQSMTNVRRYMKYDPFQWCDVRHYIQDNTDYKLTFARNMVALEHRMSSERDPNRRALARLNYAIGLRNSFGCCWVLTQYSFTVSDGICFFHEDSDETDEAPVLSASRSNFSRNKYAQKAYKVVDKSIAKALKEFTSKELIADVQMRMKNFKTVIEKYPDTRAADKVRSGCNNYIDFAMHKH